MTAIKTTQERLSEVYCWPDESNIKRFRQATFHYPFRRIETDQLLHEHGPCRYKYMDCALSSAGERIEMPVERFIDLFWDRIVPWRLEEDGFKPFDHAISGVAHEYRCNDDVLITYVPLGDGLSEFYLWPTDIDGETSDMSVPLGGIKTYKDILTLIRLIG